MQVLVKRVHTASYTLEDAEKVHAGLLSESSTDQFLEKCFNGRQYPPEFLKCQASNLVSKAPRASMVAVPSSNRRETKQQQHKQQQHKQQQSSGVSTPQSPSKAVAASSDAMYKTRQQHGSQATSERKCLVTAVPASNSTQQLEGSLIGVPGTAISPEAVAYRVVMVNYIPLGSMKAEVQQLFEQVIMVLDAVLIGALTGGRHRNNQTDHEATPILWLLFPAVQVRSCSSAGNRPV